MFWACRFLEKPRQGFRAVQDYTDDCDLDDIFAGPVGVLTCLREDAAEIGFVDHWTAWGAGQTGDATEKNATLRNIGDFKVICNDGCRDLQDAVEVCVLVNAFLRRCC